MNKLLAVLLGVFLIAGSALADIKSRVVYIYSNNCRMCIEFDRKVMSDPEVQEKLKQYNFKKVNSDNTAVDVDVIPSIIIYKGDKQIVKTVAPMTKARFLELLKKAD